MATWSIYALVDPRDGAIRYVGKSVDVVERVKGHLRDRSDTRKARWLRLLVSRGLHPLVEILEAGDGDWREAEVRWIAVLRETCDLTNACDGGEGLHNPSPETRDKIGVVQRTLWSDPEIRVKRLRMARSPERRQAISASLTGRAKSPEHIAALPQNQIGYPWSDEVRDARRRNLLEKAGPASRDPSRVHSEREQEHLRLMQEANRGRVGWALGRVLSDRERLVRSEANRGRPKSEEHREKLRQAALRRWARSRGEVVS